MKILWMCRRQIWLMLLEVRGLPTLPILGFVFFCEGKYIRLSLKWEGDVDLVQPGSTFQWSWWSFQTLKWVIGSWYGSLPVQFLAIEYYQFLFLKLWLLPSPLLFFLIFSICYFLHLNRERRVQRFFFDLWAICRLYNSIVLNYNLIKVFLLAALALYT